MKITVVILFTTLCGLATAREIEPKISISTIGKACRFIGKLLQLLGDTISRQQNECAGITTPEELCNNEGCYGAACEMFQNNATAIECIVDECMARGVTSVPSACGATGLMAMSGILGVSLLLATLFIY